MLLAALVIRVLLAFTVEGYGVDMGFGAWGQDGRRRPGEFL
ncbi:MAG: hypothetical protein ACLS7Z_08935 [Christensenellales bacterium]